MVNCSKCGAENPSDSQYCGNCGALLKVEEPHSRPILRIVGVGLLVAFIGGLIWSLIIIVTGYEIGYMATGLGAAAGILVARFRKGCEINITRAVAIGSSILGIFIGKFTAFYYFFNQSFRELLLAEGLTEAGASLFSPSLGPIFKTFIQNLPELFGVLGLIWVILAIIAAWRLAGTVRKRI
jgi:hypothetical protein